MHLVGVNVDIKYIMCFNKVRWLSNNGLFYLSRNKYKIAIHHTE